MKKSLVVLLIAVLAITSAFAALTGSATAKTTYDIDKKTFDYNVTATVNGAFSFTLLGGNAAASDSGAKAGTNYPYAEVAVSAAIAAGNSVKASVDFTDSSHVEYGKTVADPKAITIQYGNGVYKNTADSNKPEWTPTQFTVKLALDKFNIIGKNWKLDLINKTTLANYVEKAASYAFAPVKLTVNTKAGYYDQYVDFNYGDALDKIDYEGFTFAYEDFFTLGFAGNKGATEATSNYYFTLETEEKTLAEGLKAQAAIALTKKGTAAAKFAFSAKADFTSEKVSADAAIDYYDYKPEVNANLKFDVIDYTVYYAKETTLYTPYVFDNTTKKTHEVKYSTSTLKDYLSMKAVADWTTYAPSFTPVLTVEAFDLLGYKEVNVDFAATYLNYIDSFNVGVADAVNAPVWYISAASDICKWAEVGFATKYVSKIGSDDIAGQDLYASIDWEDLVVKGFDLSVAMTDILNAAAAREFTAKAAYAYEESFKATAGMGLKANAGYGFGGATWKLTEEVTLAGNLGYGYDVNASSAQAKYDEKYYANASIAYVKAPYSLSAAYKWNGTQSLATFKGQYDAEKFTAKAQLDVNFDANTVGLYVGLTSDKIVDGATLSLVYGELKSGAAVENLTAETKGAITATCTVVF